MAYATLAPIVAIRRELERSPFTIVGKLRLRLRRGEVLTSRERSLPGEGGYSRRHSSAPPRPAPCTTARFIVARCPTRCGATDGTDVFRIRLPGYDH